jgi:hypothetical protein
MVLCAGELRQWSWWAELGTAYRTVLHVRWCTWPLSVRSRSAPAPELLRCGETHRTCLNSRLYAFSWYRISVKAALADVRREERPIAVRAVLGAARAAEERLKGMPSIDLSLTSRPLPRR